MKATIITECCECANLCDRVDFISGHVPDDCPLPNVPETWIDVTDVPPEKRFYESFKQVGEKTFALNSKGCVAFVESLRRMK